MALTRDCAVCGGRFTAARSTAKYCSSRCRVRQSRAPKTETPAAPRRREGGAVIVNVSDLASAFRPPDTGGSEGLVAATERELRAANRLDTSLGAAAMFLAQVLEAGGAGQTGSSIASLIREHRTTLAKAVEGATQTETPLQRLRAARAARQIGA